MIRWKLINDECEKVRVSFRSIETGRVYATQFLTTDQLSKKTNKNHEVGILELLAETYLMCNGLNKLNIQITTLLENKELGYLI